MNELARGWRRKSEEDASLREPPGVEKPLASSVLMQLEPERGRGSGARWAGEGRLVGWAGPDSAGACQPQEGFQTLRYNGNPMRLLTRVFFFFLKFSSVLKKSL